MDRENYFQKYLSEGEWLVYEPTYDPAQENINETLFSLGNGYVGSRGIYEECPSSCLSGTFFAGIFEESVSSIAEIINAPNPFHLSADVLKTEKLDISMLPFERNKRALDLRKGLLTRQTLYKTHTNNLYDYQSMRFISQSDINLAAMQVVLTPLTKKIRFSIDCSIDTSAKNHGMILEHDTQDFQISLAEKIEDIFYLSVESLDHEKEIAFGQQLFLEINGKIESILTTRFDVELEVNETAVITKIISFYAAKTSISRTQLKENVLSTLRHAAQKGFECLVNEHIQALEQRWQAYDIQIAGDPDIQSALRFNLYHLIIAAHAKVPDVSIGAKLLTGEGYKGHVFWETELLLLPCYLFCEPILARLLLEYRFHRLEAAKELAASRGYKGALYPWESADKGRDETPAWSEDLDATVKIVHTGKQSVHINVAIFYAINHYFSATKDVDFMLEMGLPMMVEMARFWKSRVVYNKSKNLYKLRRVMGPDEFHDNVNNNSYINKLVAWSLDKTLCYVNDLLLEFPAQVNKILKKHKFYKKEQAKIEKIANHMWLPSHEKILLQFDGFLKLKYHRLPPLNVFGLPTLPSEFLVIDLYKTQFVKQADVILLLFLLPLCSDMKSAQANFHFYYQRTLHESSWSPPIHSAFAAQIDCIERAYHYLNITLNTDKKNIFGNTRLGMHAPAVAGSWVAMMQGFCGIRILDNKLLITPNLPAVWQSLTFKFNYLDFIVKISLTSVEIKIYLEKTTCSWLTQQSLRKPSAYVDVQIGDSIMQLVPEREYCISLSKSSSCFDANSL